MKNFFIKFGFMLCMGAAGLLLMAYLAPFVPPDKFWPVSFFGLAYPYILLANFVFLVFYHNHLFHGRRIAFNTKFIAHIVEWQHFAVYGYFIPVGFE